MTTAGDTEAALADVERRMDRFFDTALERAMRHSPHYQELWRELRSAAPGGSGFDRDWL